MLADQLYDLADKRHEGRRPVLEISDAGKVSIVDVPGMPRLEPDLEGIAPGLVAGRRIAQPDGRDLRQLPPRDRAIGPLVHEAVALDGPDVLGCLEEIFTFTIGSHLQPPNLLHKQFNFPSQITITRLEYGRNRALFSRARFPPARQSSK